VITNEALCVSGVEKVTTDQIIKRHPFIDAFSAATSLLLGGGGYKSMRDLVKSAKPERRGKWKENAGFLVEKMPAVAFAKGARTPAPARRAGYIKIVG